MKYAIVGGTGDLGFGLALRLAYSGYTVIIGSRTLEKAQSAADEIKEKTGTKDVAGMDNVDAVKAGDIIVLAVPSLARKDILDTIKPYTVGKIILDVTVPLTPGNVTKYDEPEAGSNAEETAAILGKDAKVVAGFHTISAGVLSDLNMEPEGDLFIAGDDAGAKEVILDMARKIGLRAFDAGLLYQARTLEGLTPIIIGLNKRYKRRHIGIKLTGI